MGGEAPYSRCLAFDPAEPDRAQIGSVRVAVRDRVLELAGLPDAARVVAFAGPGPGPLEAPPKAPPSLPHAALHAVGGERPAAILVLGDLGDTRELAIATARALDTLGVPVLIVGGGRDTRAALAAADALPHVIDVSQYAAVRLLARSASATTLIPVAGALDGGYAREADGCGYASGDLDERAGLLADLPAGPRLLVAWQAPAAGPADGGSAPLVAFARRVGARGGLFAFPHARAGHAFDLASGRRLPPGGRLRDTSAIVPRLIGPALERGDGGRMPPAVARFTLDANGPGALEIAWVPAS